jgi:hypothetical protein
MRRFAAILGMTALGMGLISGAANANVYDFTFSTTSGTPLVVEGQVVTSNSLDALGGYDISSISGWVFGLDGGIITGLEPNPSPPNQATSLNGLWYFNNVSYASVPYLDNNGVLFFAGSSEYNLYSTGPSTYFLSSNSPVGEYNPGQAGTLVASVPETATWAMMLLGFVCLGFTGYQRAKKGGAVAGV